MMAAGVRAATVTWIGPADGDWNTATNWTTGYVPGSTVADTAVWNNSLIGNVTTVVAPINNVNLTMRNGGVLNISTNMDLAAMSIGTTGNGAATVNHTAGTVVGNSFTAGLPGGSLLASYTVSGSAALTSLNDTTLQSNSLFTVSGSSAAVQVGNGNNDDLIMDGNSTLKFVLDATGVSAINVHNNFSIDATNSQLIIDAKAYEGGAATLGLVNYGGTNLGTFATNNITVIGAKGTVGYDATGMFINLVPFGPGDTLVIGQDDFDSAGVYASRTIVGSINSAPGVTWSVVSRADVAYLGMIDTSVAAGGAVALDPADVLGFLGTNKTDNIFGMYRSGATRTLTYTFNIAGYANLNLAMDWAASGNANTDKDVSMSYSIDGGATNTILDIGAAGAGWVETMDGGTSLVRAASFPVSVNGVVTNSLTDEFQTYNPVIDGTGSALTLTFVMASGVGGFGGMGMDNLKLYGTIPEPPGLPEIGDMSITALPGGTEVALSWLTDASYSYGVEASTYLPGGVWDNIITNVPGTGSEVTVTNAVSTGAEFYRAYLEE
jgi:hypothetical protein